jgi:hypothetical protein
MRDEGAKVKVRIGRRTRLAALVVAAVGVIAGPTAAEAGGGAIVTNKFFPLNPGTTFTYTAPGKTVKVKVLHQTKVIQGHTSQQVDTRETEGGQLREHFVDWYWQDSAGTVYYMKHKSDKPGESWQAGKSGAKKGIYIPADPQTGDTWKRTRAPNGGREGRDQAHAYSVSSKNLKIKVSSYANLYSETVRFYYKANVGLVRIHDKDEDTVLKSVNP